MSLMALLDRAREDDERERIQTAQELKEWRAALKSSGGTREAAMQAGPLSPARGRMALPQDGAGEEEDTDATAKARAGAAAGSLAQSAARPVTCSSSGGGVGTPACGGMGEWATWPEDKLVALLRQKPKHTPQLHSRAEFRRFFACVTRSRLHALLHTAYNVPGPDGLLSSAAEVEDRIGRRLELMDGCFGE